MEDKKSVLATFISGKDYCTMFPDKVLGSSIALCCFVHDKAYAGEIYTFQNRKSSDKDLKECVANRIGGFKGFIISNIMYYGVRIFGHKRYYKN